MYSFNGKFNHQLDEKNRIRIPAKFKPELGKDYKFMYGANETISVMPYAEYKKILDSFGEVSYFDADKQEAIASFTEMTFDVTEDKAGLVVIPAELKMYAHIDKEIVITGAASYIKIEALESYEKRVQNRDVKNIFEKLKALKADN